MRKLLLLALVPILLAGAARAQVQTLAVSYFDNNSDQADYDWLRKGLADMLITDIAASGRFQVVEREKMQELLKELRLSDVGLIAEESRQELGKMAGAELMVLGGFTMAGDRMRIDARITRVETAELVKADSVEGTVDRVFELQKELAVKIIEGAGQTVGDTDRTRIQASGSSSQSVDAARAYYEGIELVDLGRVQEAQDKFKQAVAMDPLYVKAHMSLEESYAFLKDFRKNREQREIRTLIAEIAALEYRLQDDPWITYGDLVGKFYAENPGATPEQMAAFNESVGKAYMNCATPGVCAFHLLGKLREAADLYAKYMDDEVQRDRYLKQCAVSGLDYYQQYPDDAGTGDVLYVTAYCHKWLAVHSGETEVWAGVKDLAEEMFMNHPDYRLIEFVESMYEEALDALGE